jgi:hypothetical protein
MAGNFGINYDFNYKGMVWDNKFILAYGLSKIKGDSRTAKTDDRLILFGVKRWRLVLLDVFNFKVRWTLAMIKLG